MLEGSQRIHPLEAIPHKCSASRQRRIHSPKSAGLFFDKHGVDYDERYLWDESLRRYGDAVRFRFCGPGDKSAGYLQSIAPRCSPA